MNDDAIRKNFSYQHLYNKTNRKCEMFTESTININNDKKKRDEMPMNSLPSGNIFKPLRNSRSCSIAQFHVVDVEAFDAN